MMTAISCLSQHNNSSDCICLPTATQKWSPLTSGWTTYLLSWYRYTEMISAQFWWLVSRCSHCNVTCVMQLWQLCDVSDSTCGQRLCISVRELNIQYVMADLCCNFHLSSVLLQMNGETSSQNPDSYSATAYTAQSDYNRDIIIEMSVQCPSWFFMFVHICHT